MDPARHGELKLAGEICTRPDAWRHAVRVRAVERSERSDAGRIRDAAAWIVALALHALLLVAMRHAMRSDVAGERDTYVEVRLISEPAALPATPPPMRIEPAPVSVAPHPPGVEPALRQRAASPLPPAEAAGTEAPAPTLRVFDIDGSASIPDGFAERLDRERAHGGFPQAIAASPLLAAKRPLKMRPNHFAQYWAGSDGRPLHETIWRYVTATREFAAPWGGKWGCTWVLIVIACADVPDKPWSPPRTWKPATAFDEY